MGLRSYFGFNRDAVEDRALTRETLPPVMLQPTAAGERVTPQTALRIADAYACIRALSDAAASLPLIAYRRTDDGRQRLDGPTAELLGRPAPATTQAALIGQVVAHLQLFGAAYIGKFRDGTGRIEQLALLHPERVLPELKAGRPRYAVTGPKGERSVHGPDDVIHVRAGLSIDGLTGLSPVGQARQALGLSSALTDHAARFFANDGRPGGLLKPRMEPPTSSPVFGRRGTRAIAVWRTLTRSRSSPARSASRRSRCRWTMPSSFSSADSLPQR